MLGAVLCVTLVIAKTPLQREMSKFLDAFAHISWKSHEIQTDEWFYNLFFVLVSLIFFFTFFVKVSWLKVFKSCFSLNEGNLNKRFVQFVDFVSCKRCLFSSVPFFGLFFSSIQHLRFMYAVWVCRWYRKISKYIN